jgi:hypothetical protein
MGGALSSRVVKSVWEGLARGMVCNVGRAGTLLSMKAKACFFNGFS